MKIAYLILCHTDPHYVARLVKKITADGDEAFIHVDAKVDVNAFKKEIEPCENAYILENRITVKWGGMSAVEATILMMQKAIESGNFDRYILLQGLDYPIKSNKQIKNFFEKNRSVEFIKAQNISQKASINEQHKYRLFWYHDMNSAVLRKTIHAANYIFLKKVKWLPPFRKNYVVADNGKKMEFYQGCAQFALTSDAVEYVLNFYNHNHKFNRYCKSIYTIDEIYFHTVIYNSDFYKRTSDGKAIERDRLTDFENITYFEYPDKVRVFKYKEEWPILEKSGYLFFRKATSESKELLDFIDEKHCAEKEEREVQ